MIMRAAIGWSDDLPQKNCMKPKEFYGKLPKNTSHVNQKRLKHLHSRAFSILAARGHVQMKALKRVAEFRVGIPGTPDSIISSI
jgi:hypothetical protein